jgi:hypothetical protein
MHDREARPTGAVKSAAAVASEMMILLNIDVRIAQVRQHVEETVHRTSGADFRLHFSNHFARKKVIILLCVNREI